MCSACTSSSPSAVNSAAEQSARSLMFGLYAARRSTAPISSAIAGEPRRSAPAAPPDRAVGHSSRSRTQARRAGRARRANPSGTHTVQSGSATTRGRDARAARPAREVGRSTAARAAARGRAAPRPRPAASGGRSRCGARARRGTSSTAAHRELVALADVAAVDGRLDLDVAGRRRAPAASSADAGRAPRRRPRGRAARDHDRTSSRCARRAHEPDGRQHARARRDDHRAHAERVGDRARVQRPAPPNATSARSRGSTPRSTVTTRTARSIAASTTATHAVGGRRPPRSSAGARRVDVEPPEPGERGRRPGCGRARGRRRSRSAASPPRP